MFAAAFAALALAAPNPITVDGMLCHPRRLMVKLEDGFDPKHIAWGEARVLRWMPEIGWASIEVGAKSGLKATQATLRGREGIARVDLDRAARTAYTPNDPRWADMWHATSIKANLAWDTSFGGPSAIVAVIDTGVNTAHEDLAGNIWVNTGEIPGNAIDDDLNGYIDDVNGYDFAYGDSIPNDVNGHGTPCSGLAAGIMDNAKGGCGVAPRARIMALKAAIDSGYFYDSANAPAYLYAANMGAKVLSMSFFSDRVSAIEGDAMRYAAQQGVLPVAAAGNDYSSVPYYPAGYEEVLSVAAYGTNLAKTSWSNFGPHVDVAAPGVNLVAPTTGGEYTGGFSGTSGACPQVAGLAALLFGANPGATAAQVRAAIEDTATPATQAPFGEYSNYGRVNAQAAMAAIMGSPAPARTPVVRYVNQFTQAIDDLYWPNDLSATARVYGRGFQAPRVVTATVGGVPAAIMAQTRDYVDVAYDAPGVGALKVFVDGTLVATVQQPVNSRAAFTLASASTPGSGATATGTFWETLSADAQTLNVTRRSDNKVLLHGTFRRVNVGPNMRLKVVRRFTGTTVGTERIFLYDWSSASYPYGNWVELSAGPSPTSATTSWLNVPNPARFVDPEGTVIMQIETSTNLSSDAVLRLDQAILTHQG